MKVAQRAALITYQTILGLIWPFFYIYYLCRSKTDGKYSSNYRARMGLELPAPSPSGCGPIWLHALSVGEVLSAVPLVKAIKELRPELEIVVSAATETGMSMAVERLAPWVGQFFFMPHDFPWAVNAMARRLRPLVFILVETDFWPGLLHRLTENRVPTILVNGRISPGSYRKYLRLSGLMEMIFSCFDFIFVQTEKDRIRFESLGAPAGRVATAGNLKFDSALHGIDAAAIAAIRESIGLDAGRRVWVAGSTHEGEEDILLRTHRELRRVFPDLLLIVAPRNIKRCGEIELLCTGFGLSCGVRSRRERVSGKAVYVLDTLGELAGFYGLGDAAFIGGSLVPLGGHNPLEAVSQGVPTCWGPHFYNFHEIEAGLLESSCCARIHTEAGLARFLRLSLGRSVTGCKLPDGADMNAIRPGASTRIASAILGKLALNCINWR